MKISFTGSNSDFFQTALIGSGTLDVNVIGNTFRSIIIMSLPDSEQVVTGAGKKLTFDNKGNIDGGSITGLSFLGLGGVDAVFSDFKWNAVEFLNALEAASDGDSRKLSKLFNAETIEIDATLASDGFDTTQFAVPLSATIEFKGSAHDDTMIGGNGADLFYSGSGDDKLIGGFGNDELFGGPGNDVIYGFSELVSVLSTHRSEPLYPDDNLLVGGLGDDQIFGFYGDDVIYGDDMVTNYGIKPAIIGFDPGGNDVIYANNGNDEVYGGGGKDLIFGGYGDDLIYGGAGADRIFGGDGNDVIYGGGFFGIVNLDEAPKELTLPADSFVWVDTFGNKIDGGAGNDTIHGGNGNDVLRGGAGNDKLDGSHGSDILFGGGGNDRLQGGGSADEIYGGGGNDRIFGGFDAVVYWIQASESSARGTVGSFGAGNLLYGGAGHDRITGGFLDDKIDGGTGRDILIAGVGNDRLTGGRGADVFVFAANADEGRNAITDFADGQDLIRLNGEFFSSISSIEASGRGGVNTTIVLTGGTEIILKDVDAGAIGVDDFVFI